MVISDGAEWNHDGLQYPRDWAKPLPSREGLDLTNCSVSFLGWGQGMTPKEAAAIQRHWEVLLHWTCPCFADG